jgi:hypothetical protein
MNLSLLDKSSFELIVVEYDVCFVFAIYGIAGLIKGLGNQAQLGLREDKLRKKVLILSSSSLLISLVMFKGKSVFNVSTFLSWS